MAVQGKGKWELKIFVSRLPSPFLLLPSIKASNLHPQTYKFAPIFSLPGIFHSLCQSHKTKFSNFSRVNWERKSEVCTHSGSRQELLIFFFNIYFFIIMFSTSKNFMCVCIFLVFLYLASYPYLIDTRSSVTYLSEVIHSIFPPSVLCIDCFLAETKSHKTSFGLFFMLNFPQMSNKPWFTAHFKYEILKSWLEHLFRRVVGVGLVYFGMIWIGLFT